MSRMFLLLLLLPFVLRANAENDSVLVSRLLDDGKILPVGERLLFYAEALKGRPYVSHTLETSNQERLVVNMGAFDCTTYIETVAALTLATDSATYGAFRHFLQRLRYRDGILDGYASRNHYFAQWVESAVRQGLADVVDAGDAVQTIFLGYMTAHRNLYAGIRTDDVQYRLVHGYEHELDSRKVRYFTPAALRGDNLPIQTGDILGIVTNKRGLDTVHLGIAVWLDGRLHLLNASSIHKKVVLEPRPLCDYLSSHPSQLGVRVVRLKLCTVSVTGI